MGNAKVASGKTKFGREERKDRPRNFIELSRNVKKQKNSGYMTMVNDI